MSFFREIISIFIDISPKNEQLLNDICPKNLRSHYIQEIPDISLDAIWIAAQYDDVKWLIEGYKYHSEYGYLERILPYYRAIFHENEQLLNDICSKNETIGFVPVPMHWSRYLIRGFHHTKKITKKLREEYQLPIYDILRTKYTPKQAQLTKKTRIKNRKNRYKIRSGVPIPEHVILIDDVMSTGMTLDSCARLLKSVGVRTVSAWVLASSSHDDKIVMKKSKNS